MGNMWITRDFESLDQTTYRAQPPVGLTIGAFDGVHRGHQALIRWLVKEAHTADLQAVVLTFDPLPWQVLQPTSDKLLCKLQERIDLIEALGVDGMIVHSFNHEVAATPAQTFLHTLLAHFDLRGFWVGPDFSLGRAQEGNIQFLKRVGSKQGFTINVFTETVLWASRPVRSSRIRRALRAGDVEEAHGCLGRPYQLSGSVMHGEARGQTLGFPTANLDVPEDRLLPANGVYVCRAHIPAESAWAITNVGTRPTFNHRPPTVEAHLLDFSADIYDVPMQLDFLHRLRPEVKFSSAKALIRQMQQDEAEARAWLALNRLQLPVGSKSHSEA